MALLLGSCGSPASPGAPSSVPVADESLRAPAEEGSPNSPVVRPRLPGEPTALHDVSVAQGLVVVVGDCGLLLERENGAWRRIETGVEEPLRAVAHAEGVWFVVGPPGVMLRRKEGEWRPHRLPSAGHLHAAWAESAAHALFVGQGGEIIRWRDGRARREASGTTERLMGVWGTPVGTAYAVGQRGTVVSHDGSGWSPVSLPTQGSWTDVDGPSDGSGEAWIVGLSPVSYRYDGHVWNAVSTGGALGVWARSRDDIFGVGPGGRILHYDGSRWARERAAANELLVAVSGSDETVVAVGLRGTILERIGGAWRKVHEVKHDDSLGPCGP